MDFESLEQKLLRLEKFRDYVEFHNLFVSIPSDVAWTNKYTKDDRYEVFKKQRQVFECQNLQECLRKLPSDVLSQLQSADQFVYMGNMITTDFFKDEQYYDWFGELQEWSPSQETKFLLKLISDLRKEVDDLKDVIGYLPNGDKFEEAKSRFESRC